MKIAPIIMQHNALPNMLHNLKHLFIILSCIFSMNIFGSDGAITVGPMIHMNIGNGNSFPGDFSVGIEAAYWYIGNDFPIHSFDVGFDYSFSGNSSWSLYSELQIGGPFIGISAGPLFDCDAKLWGIQGSIWGSYVGGLDLRYRYLDQAHYFCPGLFLKLPAVWWNHDAFYSIPIW
jgi:hypothetical protein